MNVKLGFSRSDVIELLVCLEKELARDEVSGEITIFGGAAFVLAWNVRPATRDIDALFADPALIRRAARRVTLEKKLPGGWLNDAIAHFLSNESAEENRSSFLDLPHLKIFIANPDYLMASKLLSARTGRESTDMDDVLFLMKKTGIRSETGLKRVFRMYHSADALTPRVRLFLKQAVLLAQSRKHATVRTRKK